MAKIQGSWICTINVLDSLGSPSVIYFSDDGYKDSNGIYYQPRMKQPARVTIAVNDGGLLPNISGQSSIGEIELDNTDGGLNYLADYYLDGRDCTLQLVDANNVVTTWFKGIVTRINQRGNSIYLTLKSLSESLDTPLTQARYTGGGGVEGLPTDVMGNVKPRVYGTVTNASPVMCYANIDLFQVSDLSTCVIDAVYDKGVALTKSHECVSLAELISDNVSAGEFHHFQGYFKVGDHNHQEITCDAHDGEVVVAYRTNLLTYSEQFDNVAWTKSNATITANATTSPDGTLTADKLVENTVNTLHYTNSIVISNSGTNTYTASIYVKSSERNFSIWLRNSDGSANYCFVGFDTTNNTILSAPSVVGTGYTSPSATITDAGNGWVRCTLTVSISVVSFTMWARLFQGSSLGYTGDGTSGVFIWGAQLEQGSFATDYIKTISTPVSVLKPSVISAGEVFNKVCQSISFSSGMRTIFETPTLIDAPTNKYQVSGTTSTIIENVYNSGVKFTSGIVTGSLSTFNATTPAQGTWIAYQNLFKVTPLNSTEYPYAPIPLTEITADFSDSSVTYATSKSITVNSSAITKLNSVSSGGIGLYINQEASFRSVLDSIVKSVGGYWWFGDSIDNSSYIMNADIYEEPSTTADISILPYQITSCERTATGVGENGVPYYSVVGKYGKIETVQKDVLGATTQARKARLLQQYLTQESVDTIIKQKHPQSQRLQFESLLVSQANTQTVTDRLLAYFKKRCDVVSLTAYFSTLPDIKIGQTVLVKYDRLWYNQTVKFRLIGYEMDIKRKSITMNLMGYKL